MTTHGVLVCAPLLASRTEPTTIAVSPTAWDRLRCVSSNVAIESRFAENHLDRLPQLAADLVRRQVNVVAATGGTSSVVAAKPVVPPTMPLVFAMGGDPVKLGIVDSLARPGGNVTGIAFLVNGLTAKHLQLLLDQKTARIGGHSLLDR